MTYCDTFATFLLNKVIFGGGQQRRTSFAVALLHEPQILILDEPTVGVDPILRKSIWKYLRELVDAGRTTVIITTHYIEEANEANRIGLMRNGRLLAEDSPQALLEKHQTAKLEDVFFNLCQRDTSSDDYGTGRQPSRRGSRAIPLTLPDTESVSEPASEDPSSGATGSSEPSENSVVAVSNENEKVSGTNRVATPATSPTNNNRESVVISPNNNEPVVVNSQPTSPLAMSPSSPESHALSPTSPTFNRSVEQLLEVTTPAKQSKKKVVDDSKGSSWFDCFGTSSSEDNGKESSWISMVKSFLAADTGFWDKMWALLFKNFLVMYRNLGFVAFIFVLPAVQAILFCVAIGGDPTNLSLGVINKEFPNIDECGDSSGCALGNMSCNYLRHIPTKTIDLIPFYTEAEAMYEVDRGKIWGYITIPENFSEVMIQSGVSVDAAQNAYEDSFQGTHVQLALDMTSQQIAFTIQRVIATSFQQFTTDLLFECGMNNTIELPPPKGAKPLYGNMEASFSEFMAPGIILSIIFFMSVALTGSAFITERKEGMLTRVLVSGVTTGQIIFAQMLTQYFVMLGQTVLVLAVMMWIFKVYIAGSIGLAVLLTIFQGTCGMAFGFLISCICTEERNAIQMALGSFYPNLLLSGVVWPLESIPMILRHVVNFLPQTMACEAMRSIFSRGWGFTHPKVWPGFVISGAWSVLFWALAVLVVCLQKK